MQIFSRDPFFKMPSFAQQPAGGIYNSYLVFVLLLFFVHKLLFWWSLCCLVLGITLDHSPTKKKRIDLALLPVQLLSYVLVVWKVGLVVVLCPLSLLQHFMDGVIRYVLWFLFFCLIRPDLKCFVGNVEAFWVLYGTYMAIRTGYVIFATPWTEEDMRMTLWSYFIGNIGLVMRCGANVVLVWIFAFLATRMGLREAYVAPSWTVKLAVEVVPSVCLLMYEVPLRSYYFYKTHRTLHESKTLFGFLHQVHHIAKVPVLLDSGTISPFEFFLTEVMIVPGRGMLPDFVYLGMELVLLREHLKGHDARFGKGDWNRHHQLHHYLVTVNFAFDPADDKRFGTLAEESVSSGAEESVAKMIEKKETFLGTKLLKWIL